MNYSNIPTHEVKKIWVDMSKKERIDLINNKLSKSNFNYLKFIKVLDAKNDGQVILSLLNQMSASERGTFLLDLESLLKNQIDNGINIWLEPIGDKNSLRNLRGIEVKNV
jgi:hypothetical protein